MQALLHFEDLSYKPTADFCRDVSMLCIGVSSL